MCQAVLPHMQKTGAGSIINFSGSYGTSVNRARTRFCRWQSGLRGEGSDPRDDRRTVPGTWPALLSG